MTDVVRLLAIADAEDRALGEHFIRERWGQIDAIISCGDLSPAYLDYLVSRFNVPCFYVRGNHDTGYVENPPGGCEDLNGRIVRFRNLRIAGLEGSRWYGGSGIECHEGTMARRAWMLGWRVHFAGGLDILVTHAPPALPDGSEADDPVHRGFESVTRLVLRHRPGVMLHGHTHLGYGRNIRERQLGATRVIDCYRHTIVEVTPPGATRTD